MREIKFRAWDKKNKLILKIFDNTTEVNWFMPNVNKKYEVTQYIGLKDNRGVDIYDEDIIEFYDGDILVKGEVEWLQEGCSFVVRVSNETEQHYLEMYGDKNFNCNVIGNIYENRDLLENYLII